MTAHSHDTHVPGCFRCDLSLDEVLNAYRIPAPVLSNGKKQYRFITAKMARRLDAERPRWRDGLVDVHVPPRSEDGAP